MAETRIQISSVVEEQLPEFIREEFPLASELLTQYYLSLESQGGPIDIIQNIDRYMRVDNLTQIKEYTNTISGITTTNTTIDVISTEGFASRYGLLLIDDEIITYTSKTPTSFKGCIRGFSGVTSYQNKNNPDQLVFTESNASEHTSGSTVKNLSTLFLKEFFNKIKKQISPGFEDRELPSELDQRLFVKHVKDFYSSKGTNASFEILFRALYGKDVEVIKPRDFLIQPSDAQYIISKDLIVEKVKGNPLDLKNLTLYQDATDFFPKARGTVIDVEKITRGDKEYYRLSLDYSTSRDIDLKGTVLGNFSIHPKTKVVTSVSAGSSVLDVDSTIGFPQNGTLIASLKNGSKVSIGYSSKTINQFFNCKNITQAISLGQDVSLDAYAYGYSGVGTSNDIRVRITGVLSDLEIPKSSKYFGDKDKIIIKTLGKKTTDAKANNWFFNIATTFNIFGIELLDSSNYTYRIYLYDAHSFSIGDSVTLTSSSGIEKTGNVSFINDLTSFTITNQGILDVNLAYTLRKNILKAESNNYPQLNIYNANVQNVYLDDSGDKIYIASSSIPNYLNQKLNIDDRSVSLQGTFSGEELTITNHGFYTGDSVVYDGDVITKGVYFVKKVNNNVIKIAKSRANIDNENYINVEETINSGKFLFTEFCKSTLEPQLLETQKIVRQLVEPYNDENEYETQPGATGLFLNGVELLNYKSKDNIYYGPIQEIIPTAPGLGYDIINPPVMSISDSVGTGATAHCSVVGGLERIDIIDPGFDYLEEPEIIISGGNGKGASAKSKLVSFDHLVDFNAISGINTTLNTIKTIEYHKFRDSEEVIYTTNGATEVSGLIPNSSYFVSVQDEYTVKLYKSFQDSVLKSNPISIIDAGAGTHTLRCKNKKRKIGSIIVDKAGENYQNKKNVVSTSGINTASNTITAINHGYLSGEIVKYSSSGTTIGGLTNNSSYYVTVLNKDQFKLSQVGLGTDIKEDFYYQTKQFIDLTNLGTGNHIFNYPPINVTVKGRIGVSTFTSQDFNATIQPIFRGKINSVSIESGGFGYGSEEIINYNKQPEFILNSGSGAQVTPIISNGVIVDVVINSAGGQYNSPPNLVIDTAGDGNGAILSPVISNGSISEIKIISGGIGYVPGKTSISVISSGSGANFYSKTKIWKINLVQRLIETKKITDDDGILDAGNNEELGLEYTHAYAPRNLRKSILASKFEDGKKIAVIDLVTENNSEVNSAAHSPIIGWAYDGNPIYGPYGYDSISGGTVRCMVPGYVEVLEKSPYRPSYSLYPDGFFIDDYEYTGDGDLDEFNGRFCVTPDYPNGVYAYFCTINSESVDKIGAFRFYKRPIFPYVIGNYFKSKPIEFNFSKFSNQDDFDFKEEKLLRNTSVYNLTSQTSGYDYVLDPNAVKNQISEVKDTSSGYVKSLGITTGGNSYQVGDKILFDSSGVNVFAEVSYIGGKDITQISVASTSVSNIEVYKIPNSSNNFIGFSSIPHNLLNGDTVRFTSKYEINKFYPINFLRNTLTVAKQINSPTSTGIITYFNVSGNLTFPYIRENDIYDIGDEQVKVLNIDTLNSRIRVIRNYNGTVGSSHTVGIALTEKTKKFQIKLGISSSFYDYKINKEFYFNPKESIGIGTISGVGINSTLYFTNPGAGITSLTIPTQSIYLPNHKLETGDSLIYSSNGGDTLSISTDGKTSYQLIDKSLVYVAKITENIIGISTLLVGLGSTGSFVGIGSTIANILYFTGIGTGVYHSFTTNYQDNLTGKINKDVATVSTASTHGLTVGDRVSIDITPGITTTIVIKYDDYNRRLVANPRTFTSSDVDIVDGTIKIEAHEYSSGQKIIHDSTSPCSGLIDKEIYYVSIVDADTIKLSRSFYDATKPIPDFVKITSASFGTISLINPPLNLVANNNIFFDVSDPSLSFVQNGISTSAFNFNFYTDLNFKDKFSGSSYNFPLEVSKVGNIGVSSDAKVILKLGSSLRGINLYYNLTPINSLYTPKTKKEIIVDNEQLKNNKLIILGSDYNGDYTVTSTSQNTFSYNLSKKPKKLSYNPSEGILKYFTTSKSAFGPIESIIVTSGGSGFVSTPKVKSISSKFGNGAVLNPVGENIGNIKKKEILDIGFDYPVDYTLRPTAQLPLVITVDPFYNLDKIGITSLGRNYYVAPELVVIDSVTNKRITDVELKYELGNTEVKILKNTRALYNYPPKIIPINNVNGVGISTISFIPSTKDVVVTLGASFSSYSDFPFVVGDKVLIENISVGVGSIGKGYNSDKYDYSLFTLTAVDPNIGGANGTITYNMGKYLPGTTIPGEYDPINSDGKVIPEKYFPIFSVTLKPNIFYEGEEITTPTSFGICQKWDANVGYLKIITSEDFNVGDIIKGNTSTSEGKIIDVQSYECTYDVDASSIVRKGWKTETGFLSNNLQRIHDSDYYQYFSYALKSEVSLDKWDSAVSTLNHTAGFKKFSDLVVETKPETFSGISTSQESGDFVGISDLSRFIDTNCINDFDLVREITINIANDIKSNEIIFDSEILQDYIESIGNRVLVIDDFSDTFNSEPRIYPYSVIDVFRLNSARSKKYLIYITDNTFIGERQVSLLTLLYNQSYGFLNQYGVTPTVYTMGFFDFNINGDDGNLLFYPVKNEVNNFTVNFVSYDMKDSLSGIGSTSFTNLGDIVYVGSAGTTLNSGLSTSKTIVGIATTYRSSKVLVQIGATDSSYYQYDELTVIHDGTNVDLLKYGQLTTNTISRVSSPGIGTYNAYISDSYLNIDFIPYSTLPISYNVSTIRVSISNTSSVGIGSTFLDNNSLSSNWVSIAASTTPVANPITSYNNIIHDNNPAYSSAYYIVSVEDTTNNEYQMSEILIVDDKNNAAGVATTTAYISEFGIVQTNNSLGVFSADVSGTDTILYFTPISDVDVQVRVFQHSLGFSNLDITETSITV